MRILVALGGNALLRRGQPADADVQRRNVEEAAAGLAALAGEHELIITHGNGPQVGLLALQSGGYREVAPYPLDVLGAESEGIVGHLLELALRNRLPERDVATLRLVPSPEPRAITELRSIRLLVDAGVLVICAGGGGIPVAVGADGELRGVEGVVDKDVTAALLARRIDADLLLLLTDVDAVYLGWGCADEHPLREAAADQVRAMNFASGSMGPKVEAACRFAEATGRPAAIGSLADAAAIVRGEAGTRISEALVQTT